MISCYWAIITCWNSYRRKDTSMDIKAYPVLQGNELFRENELIYINRSDELQEFMNVMHRHDFIEIAYVISGEGRHVIGENQYDISKGDLFIINSDTPHGFFPAEGSGYIPEAFGETTVASGNTAEASGKTVTGKQEPVVYNVVFMPGFLDASLLGSIKLEDITSSFLLKSLFPDNSNPLPDLKLHGTDYTEVGELFSKMYHEYKGMKKGYCDIIRAYLIELLIKIIRYMEADNRKPVSARNKELVEKAMDYLRHNFNSDIRLEDIAVRSFTSKNYFSRLFKEVTGTSFSDYIHKLRIDEACNLLRNSDLKVGDIAEQTGFNDIKFFYEIFKRLTGKTPGEYRGQVTHLL